MGEERDDLSPEAKAAIDRMWQSSSASVRVERERERDRLATKSALITTVVMVLVEILLGVVGLAAGVVAFFREGIAFHIAIGCAVASFMITYALKAWRTGPFRSFDPPIRVAGMTLSGVGAVLALGTVNPFLYLLVLLLIPAWYSAH